MGKAKSRFFVIFNIVFLAPCLFFLLWLSPEGSEGLWRKIVFNILIMYQIGIAIDVLLTKKDALIHNIKIRILVWLLICCLTIYISMPCIKDFSSEHAVVKISSSLCSVTRDKVFIDERRYIMLSTGEKIEISTNTYFSLLGLKECTLTIEYYPNTNTAIEISGYGL